MPYPNVGCMQVVHMCSSPPDPQKEHLFTNRINKARNPLNPWKKTEEIQKKAWRDELALGGGQARDQ